jgi:ATPase subunit of ABC transporter with duplicated ATPase domains
MSHKPITLKNISLIVGEKSCFEPFNKQISPGKHIVIMGANGAGKSTLLKIIQGITEPTTGDVIIPSDITFGYVPQTIIDYPELSGGQRFNKMLSQALSKQPDVLCLDEPTNHLDLNNKRSLVRMLQRYEGTLIIVSHDPELLKLDFDEIWHIEHASVTIFTGNYTQYLKEHELKLHAVERQREHAQKEKRELRKVREQESKRAASSKAVNKDENDRTLLGAMKERGAQTMGKKQKLISRTHEEVQQKLATTYVHKKIEPKFNLSARSLSSSKAIVSITEGSCGYANPVLHDINLQLHGTDKIAVIGDNGSGKTTLLKALLRDPHVTISGEWMMPLKDNIGYLDQHYATINPQLTVIEVIQQAAPAWTDHEVRKHLNDFLFRTPAEVGNKVSNLSGGEKARLCLASIAANPPSLLLLDEITNNIDLDTREHIIEVLKSYPGAMIIISHDTQFLAALGINTVYETKNGKLVLSNVLLSKEVIQ